MSRQHKARMAQPHNKERRKKAAKARQLACGLRSFRERLLSLEVRGHGNCAEAMQLAVIVGAMDER